MILRSSHLCTLAALFAFSTVLLSCIPADAQLSKEETSKNLQSFDYIWRTIRDQHFDPTLGGVDWQAAYEELRPKVENAHSQEEARAAMRALIAKLNQSHFNIIAREAYANIDSPARKGDKGGSLGISVRVLDGEAVVVKVLPEGAASRAGVRPGWIVKLIEGFDVKSLFPAIEQEFAENPRKEFYLARSVESRLAGAIGDTLRVWFIDENDIEVEKSIVLEEEQGKKVVFGNFPPFYLRTESKIVAEKVGYFSFSVFFDPLTLMPAFDSAIQSFFDLPGLIIDIRGNPGGIGAIPMGMAGWFIEEKNKDLGTMRTRSNTLRFVVNPRARTYRGKVAILVDGCSGSSAEIFAGGIQGYPGVKIFGTRTMGATLPSTAERLPNGDGFQYAMASYIARDGTELEGRGVFPDIEVTLSRDALLDGKDPVIERAIDWILRGE